MNIHEPIPVRTARRMLIVFLVIGLAVVSFAAVAHAAGPITRNGADYSGIRNPGGCEIMPDNGTQLHVKCTKKVGATGPAFVRYRFLKDVGGVREGATITADITTWVGAPCTARWMISQPKSPARTLRVKVPFGSYCHINSVTWEQ